MPTLSKLEDLIDSSGLQSLMNDFYEIAGIPMSIVDNEGRVLVGVGWQDICTKFHRAHPDTCRACLESDTQLTTGIAPGEFRLYRCKNHMWDVATPLMVHDRQMGNVFSGQFFFDDETIDYELFRSQARRNGFDEREYLAALDRVPRLSRATLERGLAFFKKLAQMVSRLGDANVTLEQTIRQRDDLTRSLSEANRLKDEFLSTLSHELRTPLSAVVGWTQLLLRGALEKDIQRQALEAIDRNAHAQLSLVNDVLDVARVVSGKLRLELKSVDVLSCLDAALDAVRPAAAAKQIELVCSMAAHPPVQADPDRLQQVFWNLLSNAVKFTPAGGRIDVSVTRVNGCLELSVRDSGIGIEPRFLPHVFDRFRQADGSSTRSHAGLGLGLAIVRHLVELHGGEVRASSDGPGRGATFTVTLRATAPPAGRRAQAGGAGRRGIATSLAGLRVLNVDDEPDARDLLAVMLGSCGAEVRAVSTAGEGLESVRSWRPHVVICDIAMPDKDGYSFIRELHALPVDQGGATPVVALTASAGAEDRAKALAAGFIQHVTKPAEPEALADLVLKLATSGKGAV